MAAAINHVEGWDGHHKLVDGLPGNLGDVLVERHVTGCCSCPAYGHGDCKDGIGAQLRLAPSPLILRAIQFLDHQLINLALLSDVHADELRRDEVVHVGDGLQDALPKQTGLVLVAELQCLVHAGGGPTGHSGSEESSCGADVDLNSWIAPRVEDLPREDGHNRVSLSRGSSRRSRFLLACRFYLCLVLHCLSCGLDCLGITQVAAEVQRLNCQVCLQRLEVRIQLIHQGRGRRNLQARDDIIGDALDVLHHGADGVPVRRDENGLAGPELWHDGRLPEGHHTRYRVLQTLRRWDVLLVQLGVLWIPPGVELAVLADGRRRNVEAPAPDQDLLRAVLLDCLLLVQACQGAVHPLVQAPGLCDWHMELIRRLERQVAGLHRALQDGGEGHVHLVALLLE
mmetsp:Transcript_67896/g.109399  ORF Transcript_67896/g.109399 Transcript_67896/m.109399 type:complete len:398 (+) Transcript_67896:890-2083(+)